MARIEKVPVEFEYGLAGLTRADLRVLDTALSRLTDAVRKDPALFVESGDHRVLAELHQAVLDIKRGD